MQAADASPAFGPELTLGIVATPGLPPYMAPDLAADLRRAVCRAIRAGSFDADDDAWALTSELSHTAEAWVAISNPTALRPANA